MGETNKEKKAIIEQVRRLMEKASLEKARLVWIVAREVIKERSPR